MSELNHPLPIVDITSHTITNSHSERSIQCICFFITLVLIYCRHNPEQPPTWISTSADIHAFLYIKYTGLRAREDPRVLSPRGLTFGRRCVMAQNGSGIKDIDRRRRACARKGKRKRDLKGLDGMASVEPDACASQMGPGRKRTLIEGVWFRSSSYATPIQHQPPEGRGTKADQIEPGIVTVNAVMIREVRRCASRVGGIMRW